MAFKFFSNTSKQSVLDKFKLIDEDKYFQYHSTHLAKAFIQGICLVCECTEAELREMVKEVIDSGNVVCADERKSVIITWNGDRTLIVYRTTTADGKTESWYRSQQWVLDVGSQPLQYEEAVKFAKFRMYYL